MSILLVEDDRALGEVLREHLVISGYDLAVARDGDIACELMQQLTLDLLISDILMPGKDGLEVIREFRRIFPGKAVIAISGGSELLRADLCLDLARRLGAHSVLQKPFSVHALLTAIESAAPSVAKYGLPTMPRSCA